MEKILEIIRENSKITGNGSGISMVAIYLKSDLIFSLVQEYLRQLIKSGQIYCRKGINDFLFFIKQD
ncbi:hypothetical protein [Gillisia sp. Hel1_33_143]|uniref:hypothetical protein n=1 Tax=Gillisia sp. Hel1_33_143 TaxID=1336796 RepID=UPI000B891BAB|nr:hypothetical protein [Gillisia sp. Hel1_33_143]